MSSLCCGDVGVAFAVLAVDRIDSDPRWRRDARGLTARTIAHGAMPGRFGLFQGDAGLVCLALDCLDEARGFPGIEA